MGAKTALLAYSDGNAASALRAAGEPAAEETAALVARVFPGRAAEPAGGEVLGEATYPAERLTYAGSFPSLCDRHLMFVRPSEVPVHLLEAAAGRRVILHAMHSVNDWLAFAVWEEEPYALPFHPLELGDEALRAFFGFLLEGCASPEDVDPDWIPLLGFRRADGI
ncbi:hypothetical protein AB0F11_08010 [Streptomyces sp. NPDC032472]|uniref:DUF6928 family protein n=1 Tax=Streptomyces sp. NPDC032472 TaxID=3155018 RepID=UPI00340F6CB1